MDLDQIAALREQGHSWRAIASELAVGEGTVRRAALMKCVIAGSQRRLVATSQAAIGILKRLRRQRWVEPLERLS